MKLSARNVFPGQVLSVTPGPTSTLVKIEIAPGIVVSATITTDAAKDLKLAEGSQAYAVIKSSSVLLAVE